MTSETDRENVVVTAQASPSLVLLTVTEIEAIVVATESEHEGVWTRRIAKRLHAVIQERLAAALSQATAKQERST